MKSVSLQPPSDLAYGAVDRGDGCVTFALYAPGKHSVALIGDFNAWDRSANPMQPTPDGTWWVQKQFEPGQYTYQFAVDAEIIICDPYARYLAEEAEYDPPRAVVRVGEQPYPWQHDDWQRPSFNELIIYELHVGDFSPEGNLGGVIDRLDYLRDLGINAIELMPIFEFSGDFGWGYNPSYLFTVEKSYGEPVELQRLVDAAHAHGIAIILDIVLAHTAHRHPFNRLYPYEASPWYGPGCGEMNQFGFPTLDLRKEPALRFAQDVQAYWLREFHVDGFRYDYCSGIGCCDGMGLPGLARGAREARRDAYLIAEYSPENVRDVNDCGVDAGWHVSASYALKALLLEGEKGGFGWGRFHEALQVLDPWKQGYASASRVVNYLESHDEERVMWDLREAGMEDEGARRKSALGASILFTMPGEPMLYHGQEWGQSTPRITNDLNTLHWRKLETEGGQGLFEHYRRMCHLRREHPALSSETFSLDAVYPEQKTVIYHRWTDGGDEVLVAANFSPYPQRITIPFPQGGEWHELFSGAVHRGKGSLKRELGSSSAEIYFRNPR